jgi:hypothetical protein
MRDPRRRLSGFGEQRPERLVGGSPPRLEGVHLIEHLLHHEMKSLEIL